MAPEYGQYGSPPHVEPVPSNPVPRRSLQSNGETRHHTPPLASQDPKDEHLRHLRKQFDGSSGRRWPEAFRKPYSFRKPRISITKEDLEMADMSGVDQDAKDKNGKSKFIDPYGNDYWKYEDGDTYFSKSQLAPRRLIVQATKKVRAEADSSDTWQRAKIKGDKSYALLMSEWALRSKYHAWWRVVLVALPIHFYLLLPGVDVPWERSTEGDTYDIYDTEHWYWPKHSINPLDMRGNLSERRRELERMRNDVSTQQKLLRPRKLVVYQDREWKVVFDPPRDLQYVFISWQWNSFDSPDGIGMENLEQMVHDVTLRSGLRAYWLDKHCVEEEDGQRKSADIYRMSDVIKGSSFVALMLAGSDPQLKASWGSRLWCLPEGLLAPGTIRVCTWKGDSKHKIEEFTKTELCSQFWTESVEDTPTRLLAEHYDGLISLGRLELFSLAMSALSGRETSKDKTGADRAYALMGLLNRRIEPVDNESLFQVFSRLSLLNDSDQLVERLIAMSPDRSIDFKNIFEAFGRRDEFETHLWDIQPRCKIVGIGHEENTVIIDEAKAIPIRWKRFPRVKCGPRESNKNVLAELCLQSGLYWFKFAMWLVLTYAPIFAYSVDYSGSQSGGTEDSSTTETSSGGQDSARLLLTSAAIFVGVVFGIGLIFSVSMVASVRRLMGGKEIQSAPQLIGFEGVLPIKEVELLCCGNFRDRFVYDPSSSLFNLGYRDPEVRMGTEPAWITKGHPDNTAPKLMTEQGYRLFTLVDTGNYSVYIFQAKHPPTVAVLCGAEGGMLRAVLCSWRFANDCLYKEAVIRISSITWDLSRAAGWMKIALDPQRNPFEHPRAKPHTSKGRE